MPEEVQVGTLPDEDEVRGAVGEVSKGRQTFWTSGTSAAHTSSIDGNKLPMDHSPTKATI